MAEVLGLGITHYPMLATKDEHMANLMKRILTDPDIPAGAMMWPGRVSVVEW